MPIVEGHVALMPDAHVGIGATIGSVIPTENAIIPAAVGVDIGCGMIAVETDLSAEHLPDDMQPLVRQFGRSVPAGVGRGRDLGSTGVSDQRITRLAEKWMAQHPQSRGQWGARDFDKVMFSLPIPVYKSSAPLHQELSKAAVHAEEVASAVPLRDGINFVRARQLIRTALREDGVAAHIDALVAEILKVEISA